MSAGEADKSVITARLQKMYERRAEIQQSLNGPGKTIVQKFELQTELNELQIEIERLEKPVPDIPPATNGGNGGQPDVTARPQLTAKEQRDLIELFLACPIMKTPGGRQNVTGQLPSNIGNNISLAATNTPKQEVTNIVQACLNVPGGLATLYDAVLFYDENSFALGDLTKFMRDKRLI
jgi:Effector-associated domain 2